MIIPRSILSEREDVLVEEALIKIGINYTKTDDDYIVACANRGEFSESVVCKRIFESSRPFMTQDLMGKQYAIRAMSRLTPLLQKAKSPADKFAAISAINSLFPLSPDIAMRLINMV